MFQPSVMVRSPMASRCRSGYVWSPKPNEAAVEAEVSKAAADLLDLHASGQRPNDPHVAVAVMGDYSVTPIMASMVTAEVARLKVTQADEDLLVHMAWQQVNWALAATRERNHQVIARFAARAAYEAVYQSRVTAVITDEYPRRWCSLRVRTGGAVRNELHWQSADRSTDGDKRFAFMGRKALEGITGGTNAYVEGKAAPVNVHDAYCGLPAALGWALDPIRPPIQAVRYIASLIQKYKGRRAVGILTVKPPKTSIEYEAHLIKEFDRQGALRVLAIEPGLTAAVMGLAWFMPGVEVCMFSPVLGDQTSPIAKADTVVLNLPNARSLALVKAAVEVATRRNRTLTRDEIDAYWQHPATDPGTHAPGLVAVALQHLADDGLLVVLGDVESGIHHQATGLLAKVPDLLAIKLTPKGRPVQFSYSKPPWALAGGLPATDRFVSAWMRVTP